MAKTERTGDDSSSLWTHTQSRVALVRSARHWPVRDEAETVLGLDMTTSQKRRAHFVVCVDNTDYPASLELHKIYRSLPDADAESDGDMRVVDETGEDYLYSQDRFVPIRVPMVVRESLVHAH